MTTTTKLCAFGATLAALFGGGALAGATIDPDRHDPPSRGEEHTEMTAESHTATTDTVRGLAVAEHGLRVVLDDPELRRGRDETLRFRIVDARNEVVRDFDVEHTKRMHLIVARHDLTGFQHLHPTQGADGTWSTPLRLDEAGSYRVFADFSHDGESTTLASDLRVDGTADLQPLPAPAPTAVSDLGYDVRLDRDADMLRFTITHDGQPVETETYLGAGGHLVALREGDLAFLHVHPDDDGVSFMTEFPTPGRYRLFLQFQAEGRVHTVAFTQEVK
ncbi:MAG TPA: hypothetical protein VF549_04485 [Solirubrobacteraceae bacterium]